MFCPILSGCGLVYYCSVSSALVAFYFVCQCYWILRWYYIIILHVFYSRVFFVHFDTLLLYHPSHEIRECSKLSLPTIVSYLTPVSDLGLTLDPDTLLPSPPVKIHNFWMWSTLSECFKDW